MQICKKESANSHRRWITLGTVREKYVIHRGRGCPHGVEIFWPGHVAEFFRWGDLFWAMRRRLTMRGFRLVAVASKSQREDTGRAVLLGFVEVDLKARRAAKRHFSEFC